jgi:KaiC/GvpD/RAD55 family RecA-like ATPase
LIATTSLAIVGQDGTGKSVFALHLVAAYHAVRHHWNQIKLDKKPASDVPRAREKEKYHEPLVFYVSSDLKYAGAKRIWDSFYLDGPWRRYVPFISRNEIDFRRAIADKNYDNLTLSLKQCAPEGVANSVQNWNKSLGKGAQDTASVYFIDLAERTTGDDWLFLTRLVASIRRSSQEAPPNLLVIDSIAGFETLVGEKNSFGETMSRRARIAQLVQAAGNNWHTVFVVEEPEPGLHHPEEYVTDTVLHLRRESENEKVRRILEIEKSRSRSFASGVHPFEVRDGLGSSTGSWENPDDPRTFRRSTALKEAEDEGRSDFNSYIQVFPSLTYLSKDLAGKTVLIGGRTQAGETDRKRNNVPFGIAYLDNMLAAKDANGRRGPPTRSRS